MRSWLPAQLSIMLCVLALTMVSPALAQESGSLAESTSEEVSEKATELMARIQEVRDTISQYKVMLLTASHEDSMVLRLQIDDREDAGLAAIHELSALYAEVERRGDHPELREQMAQVNELLAPQIWDLIGKTQQEIDELRAGRSGSSPMDLLELEDEIAHRSQRLDIIYGHGWQHIQSLENLGLDTTEQRAAFTSLLKGRVDALSGRLALALDRIGILKSHLKDVPGDADLTQRLIASRKSLENIKTNQFAMLALMDALELPAERYKEQMVTATGDISSGLLSTDVLKNLAGRAWGGFVAWLAESGPSLLFKIILLLLILFAGRILARIVRKAVETSLKSARVNLSQLLRSMIVTLSYNTVMIIALLIGLAQLGISLGPLLAGFGVVGFILGFAMQDSLSNLAAGMMILIYRPYDVGDLVEVAGAFGKVGDMSLVSTSVLTLDNQKLVVPNSKIWGDVIKNVTDQHIRRVDMTFGISYTDDIPKAEKVLIDILTGNDRVLKEPEPMVRLHTLGESSVDFVVRPWVKTEDYWETHWDVTRAVKMRFDEEGISIPFPQRDVHIYEEQIKRIDQAPVKRLGEAEKQVERTDWDQETAPEAESDD